jgi:hypothetical protein
MYVGAFLSLASRPEEMLIKEKGKVVAEHYDIKWLWNLSLLCDISHHLNYLNTKLLGQQIQS